MFMNNQVLFQVLSWFDEQILYTSKWCVFPWVLATFKRGLLVGKSVQFNHKCNIVFGCTYSMESLLSHQISSNGSLML